MSLATLVQGGSRTKSTKWVSSLLEITLAAFEGGAIDISLTQRGGIWIQEVPIFSCWENRDLG
jgi:hypothetical protein